MKKNYILIGILIASFLMFCNIFSNAQNQIQKNGDCGLFEDFENINPTNPGYAGSIVTTPNGNWLILGYGIMDANDRRFGERSIRLRANNSDPASGAMSIPGENTTGANVIQMQQDKANGIGTVSFYYGSYSGHSGGVVFVEYSTDGGITWISPGGNSVTSPAWSTVNAMQEFSVPINVQGNVRVRIIKYKQSGTQNSVNIDDLCITDFTDANTVATPTFTPPGGSYLTPQSVTINCTTEGATIRYTLDGSEPTESSAVYNTPLNISTTTTLVAKAWKAGLTPSAVATATYSFPVEVSNIAAFKAANTPTATTHVYKITGDVTFVFRHGRNIYIKDATGGLLIYDNSPATITNTYENGDIISGGVLGTCVIFNGLYELIPIANLAQGTPGTPVAPTIVTMENLLANFASYESQLVKLLGVTFDDGTFGTGAAANIPIHQNESSMICRNHYGAFTGYETNPEELFDVVGFAIPFNADRQIAPRALTDITLHSGTTTHIITATAGANGTIAPQGQVIVLEGADQTFTMTPNDGYKIGNVLINGVIIDGQPETYTFVNVTGSHTISVTFIALDVVANPVFYPEGGNFGNFSPGVSVEISCETDGAEIYYTINGGEPTPSDHLFEHAIVLYAGIHILKAKAFKTGMLPSETVTETYNIGGSVSENNLDELVTVYPNPTKGELRVTSDKLQIEDIEIFDVYGRKVSSNHLITSSSHQKINIETLSSGIYFIKLNTDKGEVVKKMIKE
ncbi:MAG: chitobiase/beta-hexosaminidase C-terminal domain-containing protein [Bacteroidetes bacterium]|nr:chitobiase/beta-hexosaminidase C-terminal domain-containing protein [Bacteroidota bacterium]MCL2302055.1 chitobiase/beta-hexosaminidase C-terminal domain-containing protein [Lentimicrobiaceae bacterium]MCL2303592.1 chitobiase/beta-hexosaminidase C-terminal domain-containing protein [Lentimicrobiaceae bacterium]